MHIPNFAVRALAEASTFSTAVLQDRQTAASYKSVAGAAITALTKTFSTTSFQWSGVGGWVAANAYNDIMDYDMRTGEKNFKDTYGAYLFTISTSTAAQQKVGSTDNFNDDQLWWCLAMLRAYQNYGHKELLDQTIKQWKAIGANAQVFKADQGTKVTKGGITRKDPIPATCDVDGAVYWSSDANSGLNAISTGLYAQVGSWLYALTGDKQYLGPSQAALGWLQRMMMDTKTGVLNIDAYTMDGCTKHFGSLTYNTGVYIGTLTSLYLSTGDVKYLNAANLSMTSTVNGFFGNGKDTPLVVNQQADLTKPGDGVQWRDVLFRNVADFYVSAGNKGGVSDGLKAQTKKWFKANYDQIQAKARFGDNYAANWFGLIKSGSDWGTASVLSVLIGSMMVN
ncbi:glycoside hydrolase [Halenospora varia]|nr:glycoside hydrolase [Halenospora varia]